jgi:ABC-type multidrug transport system fused ATPase/permease subunit
MVYNNTSSNAAYAKLEKGGTLWSHIANADEEFQEGLRVDLINISYEVTTNKYRKTILNGIDMTFEPGKMSAIVGPSGSGKRYVGF